MSTGKNLLGTDLGVSDAAKAEETIWRAATYTPEDVEAITAGLPDTLRVPLCKLLQRTPAARRRLGGTSIPAI